MLARRFIPIWSMLQDSGPNESVANTLMNGLIASYQFENAVDLGHDNFDFCNLSVTGSTGSVTQVTGKRNYGVTCTGKYLQGDAATDVDPGNGITLCGWFKCDNNTGAGYNRVLVCLKEAATGHTSANPDPSVFLTSTGGTHIPNLQFYDSGNTLRTLSLSAIADPTVWHFFVARFEDGNQSLQVDNDTPATSTYAIDDTIVSPQSLKRVLIGVADSAGETVTADGVLIYNRILTGYESDVLYDMSAGRFFGFGYEMTLSRVSIAADADTTLTPMLLSRVTSASTSDSAITGMTLSRVSQAATSEAAITGMTLSRATSAATSETAITGMLLSRGTLAAESTSAIGPMTLTRCTLAADSEAIFATDPMTLSRVSIAADSSEAITPATLSRVTLAADSSSAITGMALSRVTLAATSTTLAVVDPMILSRVTIAATSNRTRPTLTTPEFKYVVLSNILNQFSGKDLKFKEETSNQIKATIKDEHGHVLDQSAFTFVLLTLYEKDSKTLLTPTAVVSGGQLTIDAGALSWDLLPRDTNLIDDDIEPGTGMETHTALLEFCHGAELVEDLVDPFATTADSYLITVEHPAHDLIAGDHVWYTSEDDVGGLTLTGLFLVQSVIDVDSYRVLAHRVATSTATGGGNVVAYRKGYSNKAEISFKVVKADVL